MADHRQVTIRMPSEWADRLNAVLEWGEKNKILTRVLIWVVLMVETHGHVALGIFLREDPSNVLKLDLLKDLDNGDPRESGH